MFPLSLPQVQVDVAYQLVKRMLKKQSSPQWFLTSGMKLTVKAESASVKQKEGEETDKKAEEMIHHFLSLMVAASVPMQATMAVCSCPFTLSVKCKPSRVICLSGGVRRIGLMITYVCGRKSVVGNWLTFSLLLFHSFFFFFA